MKCSQCKEKLAQYIEGNLSADVDDEINTHLLTCESCKKVYEEELIIYDAFKSAFSTEKINFENITSKVMDSIDKDKYLSRRKSRKVKYFAPVAAALFICMAISPFALKYIKDGTGATNDTNDMVRSARLTPEIDGYSSDDESKKYSYNEDITEGSVEDKKGNSIGDNEEETSQINYVNMYSMEAVTNPIIENNTSYISTENGVYEATISGKGEFAQEEGIGTIYLKNNSNNVISEIKLKITDKQISPLSISWYDNNHLIIVQGFAYGTLANGLDVVIINVETGHQMLIATADDSVLERFVEAYRDGNDLVIKVKKYTDEIMNESIDDEIRVKDYKIGQVVK